MRAISEFIGQRLSLHEFAGGDYSVSIGREACTDEHADGGACEHAKAVSAREENCAEDAADHSAGNSCSDHMENAKNHFVLTSSLFPST